MTNLQHELMITLIIIFSVVLYILNKNRPRTYGDITEIKSSKTGKVFLIDTSIDVNAKKKPINPNTRIILLAMYSLNCPKCKSNNVSIRYDRKAQEIEIKCNECSTARYISVEDILI